MIPRSRWLPILAIGFAVVFAAIVPVQERLDATLGPYRQVEEVLYLPSGNVIKKLSLGYDGLVADIYWTRAVQYFGGHLRDHNPDFSLLYPLLDITTTLDPQLLIAYRFGSIFLTERSPRGAERPDLAIKLVEKGIKNNPDYWRFYYDLGFIYYKDLKDYQKAADAFLEGAKNPKAQPWMRVMAAKILQEGGSRQTSYWLWKQIHDSTDDRAIRDNAILHMASLQAEAQIEQLEALVSRFEKQSGRRPANFGELISLGWLRGTPHDPLRFPYHLTPEGKVEVDPKSPIIDVFLGRK